MDQEIEIKEISQHRAKELVELYQVFDKAKEFKKIYSELREKYDHEWATKQKYTTNMEVYFKSELIFCRRYGARAYAGFDSIKKIL